MLHTGDYLKSRHPSELKVLLHVLWCFPFILPCLFDLIVTLTPWSTWILQQIPSHRRTNPPRLSAKSWSWTNLSNSCFTFGLFFQVCMKEASWAAGLKITKKDAWKGSWPHHMWPHPHECQQQVSVGRHTAERAQPDLQMPAGAGSLVCVLIWGFSKSAENVVNGNNYGMQNSLFVINCHLSFEKQVF